jgi:hypothetical protein
MPRSPPPFFKKKDPRTGKKKTIPYGIKDSGGRGSRTPTIKRSKPSGISWSDYKTSGEVMEVARYGASARALPSKVKLLMSQKPGFSCGPPDEEGVHPIHAEPWTDYQVYVDDYDKWLLYRGHLWHEARHAADSPTGVFKAAHNPQSYPGVSVPTIQNLINIMEDERIELRAIKKQTGMQETRLMRKAYYSYLRPSMESIEKNAQHMDPVKTQIIEAFHQRLRLGKVKGKMLKKEYRELVEKAALHAEEELRRINKEYPEKDEGITEEMLKLLKKTIETLGIDKMETVSAKERNQPRPPPIDRKDVEQQMAKNGKDEEWQKEVEQEAKEKEQEFNKKYKEQEEKSKKAREKHRETNKRKQEQKEAEANKQQSEQEAEREEEYKKKFEQAAEEKRKEAEKIKQDAENYKEKAEEAKQEAEEYEEKAKQAKDKDEREEAKEKAEKAKEKAENYEKTAEKAEEMAERREKKAEEYEEYAQESERDAEQAKQEAEEAEEDAERWEQEAQQAEQEAQQAQQEVEEAEEEFRQSLEKMEETRQEYREAREKAAEEVGKAVNEARQQLEQEWNEKEQQRIEEREQELEQDQYDPEEYDDFEPDETKWDQEIGKELEQRSWANNGEASMSPDETWESGKGDPEDNPTEQMQKYLETVKKDAEEQGKKDRKDGEDQDPAEIYAEDVEQALNKEDAQARNEFEQFTSGKQLEKGMESFAPVVEGESIAQYLDPVFKRKMNNKLREWRTGRSREVSEKSGRVSPRAIRRTRGKKPYVKKARKSVKGEKYLFVVDFSGSISGMDQNYKKALINTLETLNSIKAKQAVVGFGGLKTERGPLQGHFKIKSFEEGNWNATHATKLAAMKPEGDTPTHRAYQNLTRYVQRHKPDKIITVTDGAPDSIDATNEAIKRLRNISRRSKFVAFGVIPKAGTEIKLPWETYVVTEQDEKHATEHLTASLKQQDYDDSFLEKEIDKLPERIINLIAPEG